MKKRRDWSVAIAALVLAMALGALLWYSRMGPGARALATPVLAATDEGVWAVRGRGKPELIYRWQSDRHMLQYPAQWMWGEVTLVDDDELMTADEDGVYEAADWGADIDWSLGTQAFTQGYNDWYLLAPEEPEYGPLEGAEGEVPYRAVKRLRWYDGNGDRGRKPYRIPADATAVLGDGRYRFSAVYLSDSKLAVVQSRQIYNPSEFRVESYILRTIDAPRGAEIYTLGIAWKGWAVLWHTAPDTVTRRFLLTKAPEEEEKTDRWLADYWTQFQHPGLARPHLLDVSGKERMLAYLDETGRLCIYREREGMADTTVLDESPGLTSLEGAAFSGCSLVLPMSDGGARVYQHYQIYTTRYRDRWRRVDLPGNGF